MDALSSGRADQRVIVQRRDGGDSTLLRDTRQIEREVQQIVDVQDIGAGRVEHVAKLRIDPFGAVGLAEVSELPVVHDLGDRNSLIRPPTNRAMRHAGIVLGGHHEHISGGAQFPRQLKRVDLQIRPDAAAGNREWRAGSSSLTGPGQPPNAGYARRTRRHQVLPGRAAAPRRTSAQPHGSRETCAGTSWPAAAAPVHSS